jgi:hypothetical protein
MGPEAAERRASPRRVYGSGESSSHPWAGTLVLTPASRERPPLSDHFMRYPTREYQIDQPS